MGALYQCVTAILVDRALDVELLYIYGTTLVLIYEQAVVC